MCRPCLFFLFFLNIKPPALCEFQIASYVLSYTDGRDTWSVDPEPFTPGEVIKDEIETESNGIVLEREYTLTATVITEYGNVSSHTVFGKFINFSSY